MSEVRPRVGSPACANSPSICFVVAALLVAAIPSVAGAQTPPPDTGDPGAVPGAHPSRQDPGRRALRRRRRTAVPRLGDLLQRGRLGAGAAHLPRLGRLRHRADTDRQARREGRPAQRAQERLPLAQGTLPQGVTAGRAPRTTSARQEARPGARHRRDLAVELRRDPEGQLHVRHELAGRGDRRDGREDPVHPGALQPRQAERRGGVLHHRPARGHAGPHREQPQARGLRGWQQLFLKPDASTDTTVQYKSGARADIEGQGYRIVANVGDQYSDLAGGHEDIGFKLANPFYFLP